MLNISEKQEKTVPDTKKPSLKQRLGMEIRTCDGNGMELCIRCRGHKSRACNSHIFAVGGAGIAVPNSSG